MLPVSIVADLSDLDMFPQSETQTLRPEIPNAHANIHLNSNHVISLAIVKNTTQYLTALQEN